MYNVTMQTTSHFIGIALDSSKLTDLFVDLQKYFRSHDVEGAIELQNILSLHITLYYLESSLAEDEKATIAGRFRYVLGRSAKYFRAKRKLLW